MVELSELPPELLARVCEHVESRHILAQLALCSRKL